MTLYLLRYNNYFNRMLKLKDSLEDYIPYMIGDTINNVNFNPNDGIWAEQVINWNNDIPDYLLVVDKARNINSRWFVIESKRTLGGQFKLTLFRDTLADYYDEIVNDSTMFIEKGLIQNTDSAIYNSEDMTFNQIKTNEIPLKDALGCAWVVGYCSSEGDPESNQFTYIKDRSAYDVIVDDIEDWPYYQYSNLAESRRSLKTITEAYASIGILSEKYSHTQAIDYILWNKDSSNYILGNQHTSEGANNSIQYIGKYRKIDSNYTRLSEFISASSNLTSERLIELMLAGYSDSNGIIEEASIDGKTQLTIYAQNTQKGYSVNIFEDGDAFTGYGGYLNINAVNGTPLYQAIYDDGFSVIQNEANSDNPYIEINDSSYLISASYKGKRVGIEISETISTGAVGVEFPSVGTRRRTKDAPYDIFAIPYGDITVRDSTIASAPTFKIYKEVAIEMAQEIARKRGGTWLYDIQLLPYSPIDEFTTGEGKITFDEIAGNTEGLVEYIRKGTITDGVFTPGSADEDVVSMIVFPEYASFRNISAVYDPTRLDNKIKIRNEVETYRICSPNYSGIFEFNAIKNGKNYIGPTFSLLYFDISCTYKPFSPFIQVSPQFGGLYGANYNDNRGLICGGEFSLPIVTDAWEQYQLNNKNYQNAFERKIENMEVIFKNQRIHEKWGIATGAVSGAVSGATTGAYVGGGYGAIAGAVVGGTTSLIGGLADRELNEALRIEQMDLTRDLYGYELGNIKALPNTLSRVSSFDINNKIFPILEYYICTSEEIQALTEKIKNNGMTVMRIDKMSKFLFYRPEEFSIIEYDEFGEEIHRYGFLKAKLIRLDGINDDFHVVKTIANELNKGVFI